MDRKQINQLHRKIVKLVYAGRLFGAIAEIKAQGIISQHESNSALISAEDTYKMMLKYSVKGIEDPNRDKIFSRLQISLLYAADILRYMLMKKFYPSALFPLTAAARPKEAPNDQNTVQWFEYIIRNTSMDSELQETLMLSKNSTKLSWENMSLIISALTLSSLIVFDIKKFKLLLDFYLENKNQIWQRALFGIFMIA